jgi:biotin transport system substrate-specific component
VSSSSLSPDRSALVLADLLPGARVRDSVLIGVYALAIAASAQLAVPLPGTPVPLTGQTFVVLLGAAALGTARAAIGGGIFLGIGLLGVPWFAVTSGATYGYIVGFVAAAAVVGWFAERGWLTTWSRAAVAMVAGNLTILALGAIGMMLVLGSDPSAAIAAGVVPFLVGDAIKVALATALLPPTQRLLDR